MRIAIVGAGQIGGNLARLFVEAGHEVAIANSRGPETLTELVKKTGATAAAVNIVATDADVVVISIPVVAVPTLPEGFLKAAKQDAVVIDTNNYYPARDGHIGAIESGTTESRWVADQLQHPVVKAFNNIAWRNLATRGRASGDPDRLALPVAGDDHADKTLVFMLIDQIGFDAVDAGNIDGSWKQQPGSPVYGAETDADGVKKLLSEATPQRAEAWKA